MKEKIQNWLHDLGVALGLIEPPLQPVPIRTDDEQRRRQGKRRQASDEELYQALPGDEVNADNTVPVAPLMGEQPRQGLLVDIEV